MASARSIKAQNSTKGGLLLAACVIMLALPSAVLAFSTHFASGFQNDNLNTITPETTKENLARVIAMRSMSKGDAFPFTPAGTPRRQERAVTVAVRVDPEAAKAIIVRNRTQARPSAAELRVASTAFNLGVSRGYQNFAQNLIPQPTPKPVTKPITESPDLKQFSLAPGNTGKDVSRFSPRLNLDEKRTTGRAPRTFSGDSHDVDLGGSYRVTDNLNVTAGVRYSQDRERLVPLTDGKLDGQAVYVGTQFRF